MSEVGDTIKSPTSKDKEYPLHPKTIKEAIRRWDKNESLFTIEMGGFGPGYEQALQIAMFELLKEYANLKRFPKSKKAQESLWKRMRDHKNDTISELQLSGAQWEQALNLSWQFAKYGWEETLKKVEGDRWIQVSKEFP